jgi:hypothetical protein
MIEEAATLVFRDSFAHDPNRVTDAALALENAHEAVLAILPPGVDGEFDDTKLSLKALRDGP